MTYKNEDVIKEFVNYGCDETIKAENLYFEQDILYSFGFHYPLCIRLKDSWLINENGYSQTTTRHKNMLIRNINPEDIKFFTTEELKDFMRENLSDKGLRFITIAELNKLRIIKNLN